MKLLGNFTSFWLDMFDVKSKTSRKDYWLTMLSLYILFLAISQVSSLIFGIICIFGCYAFAIPISYMMLGLYFCSCIIPFFALSLRRINDLGLKRIYIVYALLPPAFLVLMCLEGKKDGEDIIF